MTKQIKVGSVRLISGKGEKVKLRARQNVSGVETLYLDYFLNSKRKYEFLKLNLIIRPSSPFDREDNKRTLELAKSIRRKRNEELDSLNHDFIPSYKRKVNFVKYCEHYLKAYTKKDKRVVRAAIEKLKFFIDGSTILTKEIDEKYLIEFQKNLQNSLNGETPYNYFKKIKSLFKQATKDGLFNQDPAKDIQNTRKEGIRKDILTFEEIKELSNTQCGNQEIKDAFLFCCLTGLRFCDVKILKAENIKNDVLKLIQQKTDFEVIVNLNSSARKLIKDRLKNQQLLFYLPSSTACNKVLKTWSKTANIDKHVTWHVARHSFGTNLFLYNGDVKSVSSLLGHKSMRETEKYVRVAEKLKEQAVNNLPSLD